MRALLGVLLLSTAGCDALWSGFINVAAIPDGGISICGGNPTCDLAGADLSGVTLPDLSGPLPGCTKSMDCSAPSPACDLNTGMCVASVPTPEAFPPTFEASIPLDNRYMVMASGDFDGDGMIDVAVTGVFSGGVVNSTSAGSNVLLRIYRGTGSGTLVSDGTCPIGNSDKPVYLLSVPNPTKSTQNDLLVAMYDTATTRCTRITGSWAASPVPTGGALPNGFKQLAQMTNPGQTFPDLAVQVSTRYLFIDGSGQNNQGSLSIHRGTANSAYNGTNVSITSSNVNWITTYRLSGQTTDILATTWDDPGAHPGIEFHGITAGDMITNPGIGGTAVADTAGTAFGELNSYPLPAVVPLRVGGQNAPSLLFTYSQNMNSATVLYGATVPMFIKQDQKTSLSPIGLMLPYAGDINNDGTDEIGIYSMSVTNATTRRLQILSFKGNMINSGSPLTDIPNPTENYRGMAIGFLGDSKDRRRSVGRKDLIALLETPGGNSRLLIRRADLNYQGPF